MGGSNLKRVDVTYVLLFDDKCEKVLMVKNIGNSSSYYTLPGGAVEEGETLEEAAIREVKEETGFDVEIDHIFSVSEVLFEDKGHHVVFFIFRGRIIGGEVNISMPEEIEKVTWMDSFKAEEYIHIANAGKGLLKSGNSAPYLLRGLVVNN